jgi:hypothetical protein
MAVIVNVENYWCFGVFSPRFLCFCLIFFHCIAAQNFNNLDGGDTGQECVAGCTGVEPAEATRYVDVQCTVTVHFQ